MRITIQPPKGTIQSEPKVVKPRLLCPNCHSNDISGHGMIIGYGYINLNDMSVDECDDADEFEVYDQDNLTYTCQNCDHEWGD